MQPIVERLLNERQRLRSARGQYLDLCQDIAEVTLPHRANFNVERSEGSRRGTAKFDSTGMLAHRGLKDAINAMLKPRHEKWLFVRPEDDRLKNDPDVLLWCEDTEQRMWNAIYDRRAQFMRFSGEVDDDLVAFGQGHLFIGVNDKRNGLRFRSFHIKDVVFGEDLDGHINRMFLDLALTCEQALELAGGDVEKLPDKVKKALKEKKGKDYTKKHPFYVCIYPNDDYDPKKAAYNAELYAPFRECIISPDHDKEIAVSGYIDFPVATPRWDTSSGEFNARSPASIALGDILSSQQVAKTLLKAGHLAVEPPLVAPHNAVVGKLKMYPGGINYFNADAVSGYGRDPPIKPLMNALNLPWGQEIQKDLRDQTWLAFFRNVLNLPIDGPQMTAAEIMQRRQEFLRTVGPVFGRLEADYTAHIAQRVFNIMRANNALTEPPEKLQGVQITTLSPVWRVLKQVELDGFGFWMEDMAKIAAVKGPHVFDAIDEDKVSREAASIRGMPQRWLRSDQDIKAIRERRAEMEAAAQMKDDMERAAGGAVNVAKTIQLAGQAQQKAA